MLLIILLFTYPNIVLVALKVEVDQTGALPTSFAHYTRAVAGGFLYCHNIVQLTAVLCSVVSGGHRYKAIQRAMMLTSGCFYWPQCIIARRAYISYQVPGI